MSQTISPKSRPLTGLPGTTPMPPPGTQPLPPEIPVSVQSKSWAKRQAADLQEIKQGLADGSITQAEASKLLAKQARVSSTMDSMFEDGEFTNEEMGRLWGEMSEAHLSLFSARINDDRGKPVLDASMLVRQGEQLDQLAQGLISGELSGKEASALLDGQAGLAQVVSEVEADGESDWLEQLEVGMKQEDAGYNIASATQNEERALHGLSTPPNPPQPL